MEGGQRKEECREREREKRRIKRVRNGENRRGGRKWSWPTGS